MSKHLFIYFLTIILITSVVVPTYITLSEKKCESSLVNDTSDNDENIEEFKIKLYYSNDILASYQVTEIVRKVLYLSKTYTSISRKLESPPPELLG
ncbi:hypothetical protein [Tenacibaculum halocynthiae]|uniref:hypothetical protein n=1 Tax=Tenacibaculum halocynthiae TaxID=1254437 RepID=UPI003D653B99